jgi:hypothetical protein
MTSAIGKRLDRLEALLAGRLNPTVAIWLSDGEDEATRVAAMRESGELGPRDKPRIVRWMTLDEARMSPDWVEPPAQQPLAIAAPLKRLAPPLKRLTFRAPPQQEPPPPEPPKREEPTAAFHRRIVYPRSGVA